MKRSLLLALSLCGACAHGTTLFGRRADTSPEARADSLYWSAIANLNPSNRGGTLNDGLANLDAYLASPGKLTHTAEANALRSLARSAQQLSRVEAALQQARASAASGSPATASPDGKPAEAKGRDEEMVKEIQRLKEELAKANEELERIKKRLATPKP